MFAREAGVSIVHCNCRGRGIKEKPGNRRARHNGVSAETTQATPTKGSAAVKKPEIPLDNEFPERENCIMDVGAMPSFAKPAERRKRNVAPLNKSALPVSGWSANRETISVDCRPRLFP